ncbi:hypothetical protein QA641_38360 [Bradyrhizobium sp. CB1650]|uniref:hypothetical protein n=1 Tax=Bradyrhizobium sp. CB1650 TaxID=3039153 RepID=UPI00243568BA|nr:hypothetical protein [Bradyrhizobium sp. CB1650]WGD51283.1 hypothetical protein QA641_38360 [Bradyrhizobium sp. CB1650]
MRSMQVSLAIKQVQPRAHTSFAGYSSDAIQAYAIAEPLLSIDEVVSFMAFIDVSLPAASSNASLKNWCEKLFWIVEAVERGTEQCSVSELLEKAQQIEALDPDHDLHSDVCIKGPRNREPSRKPPSSGSSHFNGFNRGS